MLASLDQLINNTTSLALAWLVASVLAIAGFSKLAKPRSSAEAIYRFGVVRRVAPVYGALLGVMEIAIGVALLLAPQSRTAGIAAVLLVTCFVLVIVRALRRGEQLSCGCFSARSDQVGVHTLTRAMALLLLSVLVVLAPASSMPTRMEALLASCLAIAMVGGWVTVSALMRHRGSWKRFLDKEIDWLLASELNDVQNGSAREVVR